MTVAGWIFLASSWCLITWMMFFSYRIILSKRAESKTSEAKPTRKRKKPPSS